MKRLQQRLYRWIVPDSALSGWRSFSSVYHAERPWSLAAWVTLDGSTLMFYRDYQP